MRVGSTASVPLDLSGSAPRPGGGGGGMKTFLRGALPAAVFAAVLALPGGEAQARDECGALSSGAATCSDQAYASGIRYDAADGWGNGVAGDVALTVTGGSNTAITIPTATGFGSGIVVRTAVQGASDATSRTIALTVGSGTNAVAITQSTNTITDGFDNNGIVIHQRGKAADATTVTLGSGVTIGTSTLPVKKYGIQVLTETDENLATGVVNTGAQKVTTAATIHSTDYGILIDNRGRGNTEVTNTGSITTATTGGNLGLKDGIHILDWSHTLNLGSDESSPGAGDGTAGSAANFGGNARTTTTKTTVTNSGAITVGADNASGIRVIAEGLGLYRVVHSGTGTNEITASGAGGRGISVDAKWHRGTAATDAVEIESSGDITADRAGSVGIFIWTQTGVAGTRYTDVNGNTEQELYPSSANIKVVTTGGTITGGTGGSARGILVVSDMVGATPAEIRNAATINSEAYGIVMDARGSGNITVANSGAVTVTGTVANGAGIRVVDWLHNPGHATEPVYGGADRTADTVTKVTNSGAVKANAAGTHGIHVDAFGLGRYEFIHGVAGDDGTVAGSIAVSGAGAHGIFIDADYRTGAADTDAVTLMSSGTVMATGADGVGLYVRNRAIAGLMVGEGADAVADADLGGRIAVTNSGAVTAKKYAIAVETGSPGAITVTNSGALKADGVNAAGSEDGTGIRVVDSGIGAVAIANSGGIDATGHGILARKTGSAGGVTVTHSAGDVAGKGRTGISAAIGSATSKGNPGAVRVDVTGGSVTASATRSQVAVHARTWGTGSVAVTVGKDATLTARNNAGVFAVIEDNANNTAGQISIDQGGTVSAASGVYALVTPASASGASRAANAQPLIDITWTGSFSRPTGTATAVQANDLSHALALGHELAAVGILPRIAGGAGIVAEAMSWRTASNHVSTADRPAIADTARADAVLAATEPDDMSTDEARADWALRTAVLAEIGEALAGTAYTIPGVDTSAIDTDNNDALSADEIATWLGARDDRHTVMTNALGYAFTDEEAAVLEALAEGSGLEAALDALETAVGGTLPAGYRDRVTALAGYHNVGNIRIRVNGGSIVSASDGVRALYAFPDLRNGAIELTVAEGATVTGAAAGVYVANAGRGSDGILNQHVTVNGTVTGGTDAAVHLAGGGRLTVGRTGRVVAGSSGRAVLVNDPGPAEIVVDGLVRGRQGAPAAVDLTGGGTVTVGLTGKVEAGGATLAIRGAPDAETTVEIHVDNKTYAAGIHKGNARQLLAARVDGGTVAPGGGVKFVDAPEASGRWSGLSTTVPTGSNGVIDVEGLRDPPPAPSTEMRTQPPTTEMRTQPMETRPQPVRTIECDALRKGGNNKCGLYEALPSALLAMNTLSSRDDRLSAARDANGGWALVEGASSEWKAASATQPGVAYDLRRYGMRAGVELASGEGLRVGVSAHHLRGNAKMESAGEIEISGAGAGVNAAFSDGDGFYADAQAAVTWFDAELSSAADGMLKRDANGFGYAMGLEAGKRIDMSGDLSVTPRAALAWSNASLDTFADSVGAGTFVSVEEAQALTGRAGVRVEAAPAGADGVRLFGALDVSHLLSQGAEAQVVDKAMKTTSEETGLRAGVGASWSGGEGLSLQGAAHYAASGGDNSGFGGSLSLALRF